MSLILVLRCVTFLKVRMKLLRGVPASMVLALKPNDMILIL